MPKAGGRTIKVIQIDLSFVGAVSSLDQECNPNPFSVDRIQRQLSDESMVAFGAIDLVDQPGSLVGYLLCDLGYEVAEVVFLGVAKAMRRGGVGQALMTSASFYFRNLGCHSMLLEVRSSNVVAIDFYASRGFKVSGRRASYYVNPVEDALLMDLHLS